MSVPGETGRAYTMKRKKTRRETECETPNAAPVSHTARVGSICMGGGGTATITQFPERVGALLERAFTLLESQQKLIEALSLPARRGRLGG